MVPHRSPIAQIEAILRQFRRQVRAHAAWHGALRLGVFLVVAFWLSLAIDWMFEFPVAIRAILLMVVTAVAGYLLVVRCGGALLRTIRLRDLALVLERKVKPFQQSLITAVEFAPAIRRSNASPTDLLLGETARAAAAQLTAAAPGSLLPWERMVMRTLLVAMGMLSIGGLAVFRGDWFDIWQHRNLRLSSELWPRWTELLVEGFNEQGQAKVALGSDFHLVVRVPTKPPHLVPRWVELRPVDRSLPRVRLVREGAEHPADGEDQIFTYDFHTLLAHQQFHLVGGDQRIGPLEILALESPTLSQVLLHCDYPSYTQKVPAELPVAGLVQLPQGTRVKLLARSNQPLAKVELERVVANQPAERQTWELSAEEAQSEWPIQVEIPELLADTQLLFTLHDREGIVSREPIRVALAAGIDEPPQVAVTLHGIGRQVTPQARLPWVGQIKDDYGVGAWWVDYQVDQQESQRWPGASFSSPKTEVPVDQALELADLGLKPKQRIKLTVAAEDACALSQGANRAATPEVQLEVVRPEQLLVALQAQELNLRRRLETIQQDLVQTRQVLSAIVVGPLVADTSEGSAKEGDEAAVTAQSRRLLQVERVEQNSQRSAEELRQLALAVESLADELENNQIGTSDALTRLREGVAQPLNLVAQQGLPSLAERVKWMKQALAEPDAGKEPKQAALAQADGVIAEIQQVLDRMILVESYHEVVDLLREIMQEQAQLTQKTKDKQKRQLLEDE